MSKMGPKSVGPPPPPATLSKRCPLGLMYWKKNAVYCFLECVSLTRTNSIEEEFVSDSYEILKTEDLEGLGGLLFPEAKRLVDFRSCPI